MSLPTVLYLTAVLEGAAAFAGWAGAFAYAVCRPGRRAAAWRHGAAVFASVTLACFTYFTALVALGQRAVLSGDGDRAFAAAGLLLLSAAFGLAAGVPAGSLQRLQNRSPLRDNDGEEGMWPVARRASTRFFLPFAIVGLLAFAPRADGGAAGTAGGVLVGALLVAVLAAVAAIALRHRRPVLKLAGWGALAGVPLITALLALSGVSLGEAFVFSAASALVWAPAFGLAAWAVTGAQEAGYRVTRTGSMARSAAAPAASSDVGAPKRPPYRTRRRNKRA